MSTHPGAIVCYDNDGNIFATVDFRVATDDDGNVIGLVDFMAHEEAGGENTDIIVASQEDENDVSTPAKGSKVWPEYLGARFHDFKVELDGPPGRKKIKALVHRTSGLRRERADVDNAIAARIAAAAGAPADIRDLVGGPDRPLDVDPEGRVVPRRRPSVPSAQARLPVIRRESSPNGQAPGVGRQDGDV